MGSSIKRGCTAFLMASLSNLLLLTNILAVYLFWMLCWSSQQNLVDATHLRGTFETESFFKFLVKFGFQKAETHRPRDSFGYIYGNITSYQTFQQPITLAVLDRSTFIDFYSNRSASIYDRELACKRMFQRVQKLAYDPDCNPHGKRDFLRRIPCPYGQLCFDEDTPSNVVNGNQFAFVISEVSQPRFWYVAMVACYRDRTTCQWHSPAISSNDTGHDVHYDIHVVNGHPNASGGHPLSYEFSFDQQNILEMYLIFLLVYIILLPMQIYAVRIQKHPVTRLFTISLLSEFVSLTFITTHLIKFAINGVGMPNLQTSGDILDIFSRATFMLILLLLAKGWAVTRLQISRTGWIILMSIWIPYCAFHVFLYYWNRVTNNINYMSNHPFCSCSNSFYLPWSNNVIFDKLSLFMRLFQMQTEVDIISDVDEYQTWPGWIVLILRTSFMLWFLYELRNTMKYEHSTKKLDFLLHLGASSLVWFIYLPIVATVALQISPMWRYKLLLGITNSADCLAYCIMTGLLWPNRSGQYLLLTGTKYAGMDELDEFNEAPHIVRERERRQNSLDATNATVVVLPEGLGENRITSAKIEEPNELLDSEEMEQADYLTNLNRNSHIVV